MSDTPTEKAMATVAAELMDKLGKRCDRFEVGCLTCASWRSFDDLSNALYLIEENSPL